MYGINNGGTISNCYNKVNAEYNITNAEYNEVTNVYFGAGICGRSTNGIIKRCYNTGNILGNLKWEWASVNGIAGRSKSTIIEECYNTGNITGIADFTTHYEVNHGDANCRACGIVDELFGNSSIINCYNTGEIKMITKVKGDVNPVASGILGQNPGGIIKNCYNAGYTSVVGDGDVPQIRRAAICGCNYYYYNDENSGIKGEYDDYINCYYLKGTAEYAIGSNDYEGCPEDFKSFVGNVKTSEELKQLYTTLGDAYKEDTQNINNGYPIFSWQ